MFLKKCNLSVIQQLFILIFLSIGLNINTLFNEYAVDDEEVITKNFLVAKGIHSIPKILTTDFLYGTSDANNALSQSRYRPFALVVFAIEYQLFGANPFVSHLINIILFALLIVLLFKLLVTHLFREQHKYFAFITCLIFLVHPIHTEVIANVKSRDELLAFVLLIISLISFFNYFKNHSLSLLIISLLSFFLALLTRESAVTEIAIIPLVLYFNFYQNVNKLFRFVIPFIIVFLIYILLRILVVGISHSSPLSIMDSPFLFATYSEAFATKVYIVLKNIVLLVFPYPLSCDYGYNQIPYISFFSIQFIFSLILIVFLIIYAAITLKRKSIFSFSIIYFFITIFLATNLIVDIGTPLSERLLFQPSLAFCLVTSAFYCKTANKFHLFADSVILVMLIFFSVKTFSRNIEWKNNQTLYFKDVISSPNSLRTNYYAAVNLVLKANNETNEVIKKKDYLKAIIYGEKAISIFNKYSEMYLTLGYAYFGIHNNLKAAESWILANKLNPESRNTRQCMEMLSNEFFKQGYYYYTNHKIFKAIEFYKKAIELNEKNVEAWYHLGGNYFLINNSKNGIEAWQIVVNLAPSHTLKIEDFNIKNN